MGFAYLEIADFLLIAETVLGVPSETLARSNRIIALAESALAAPAAAFEGEEFYPEFTVKAAILCSHLVRNHPLPDGNKRTAFLCLIEFIERNGYEWRQSGGETEEDTIVETIVRLAAGQLSDVDFADWLSERVSAAGT